MTKLQTNTEISYYKNVSTPESSDKTYIELFLQAIRSDRWQDSILKLRSTEDEGVQNTIKKALPNVTLSGLFSPKRADENLIKHSDFIGIDLDGLGKEVETVKTLLSQDPYVFACFVSSRGRGLCAIFKIKGERHREAFEGIADYLLKKYQLVVDPTGINVSRARFVSYDPQLYIAENYLTFKRYLPKPKARKIQSQIFVQDEFDRLVSEMVRMNVSCVEDYRDWRDIAFGLSDQFGEGGRSYFHQLSSISAKYDSATCDKQYDACLKNNSRRSGLKRSIATIYFFAKQAGINISSERTKKIAAATSSMKRAGLSAKTITENLKKFEGITDADEIIQQAFAENKNFDDQQSIVENVRTWLKINYPLRCNEVTRKVEIDGKPLRESDLNTIFLEAKIIFDKLTFDLFMRVVQSNNTPNYNPIKNYLEDLEWDGVERLSYLGGCITSDTGDLSWRCLMVRKWIVGIVASVYGITNELYLIFAGVKYTGKTEFFRRILPKELKPYFGESQLIRGKDDELLMTEKLIILNDEYGGKNRMDERNEKRLMAAHQFDLRVPYGKGNETVKRLASLCGTCNETDILDDDSGNRRKIIIAATGRFNFNLYNEIPKKQLFAEAYRAFKNGETPTLDSLEIEMLERFTDERYSKPIIEAELIQKYFYPADQACENDFMTATEIKIYLEQYTRSNLNLTRIGSKLKKLGYERPKKNGVYVYRISKKMISETVGNQSAYPTYFINN